LKAAHWFVPAIMQKSTFKRTLRHVVMAILPAMFIACGSPDAPTWKSTFYEADYNGQLWRAESYLETADSIILHLETSEALGEDLLHCVWYDADGAVQDSVTHRPRTYETEWWLTFKPGDDRPLGNWEIRIYRANKAVHKAKFVMGFDPIQLGFFTVDSDTLPVELIPANAGIIKYHALLRRGQKGDRIGVRLHYIEADSEIDSENEGMVFSVDYTLPEEQAEVVFDLMPATNLSPGRYAAEFTWFGESIGWSLFRITP